MCHNLRTICAQVLAPFGGVYLLLRCVSFKLRPHGSLPGQFFHYPVQALRPIPSIGAPGVSVIHPRDVTSFIPRSPSHPRPAWLMLSMVVLPSSQQRAVSCSWAALKATVMPGLRADLSAPPWRQVTRWRRPARPRTTV